MIGLLVLLVLPALAVLVIGGSLAAHAVARRTRSPRAGGDHPAGDGPTAVVVLGYPSRRNGTPHAIQRWRSRLAVRTVQAVQADRVVFTGGSTTGDRTEAAVMAEVAARLGLGDGATSGVTVLCEDTSISTWQNVANTMDLVADASAVVLVSDPLHAARAKAYWLRQRPEDTDRVEVTDQSGLLDHWWLQVPTAVREVARALFDLVRTRRRRP